MCIAKIVEIELLITRYLFSMIITAKRKGITCETNNENGNCKHLCTDVTNGYYCHCRDGFQPNPDDPYDCIDIDECMGNNTCTQVTIVSEFIKTELADIHVRYLKSMIKQIKWIHFLRKVYF